MDERRLRRTQVVAEIDPLAALTNELPPLATTRQIEQVTSLSRATIARAIASGALRCVRIGRNVRVTREQLREWISSRTRDNTSGDAT